MADFDYDVFISFASSDQPLVKPLWQELTGSGLRIFWSDSVLRDRVGASWFEVIQELLDRSRHFILLCTQASLSSKWVKREYVAFYNHCYHPPSRLLVPVLAQGVSVGDLPLFLREIEACSLRQPDLLKSLIRLLGGVDVASLQSKLAKAEEDLAQLRAERDELATRLRSTSTRKARAKVPVDSAADQAIVELRRQLQVAESDREMWRSRAMAVISRTSEPAVHVEPVVSPSAAEPHERAPRAFVERAGTDEQDLTLWRANPVGFALMMTLLALALIIIVSQV